MDSLWTDIRFAARQLAKRPGFTLIALLTFGIGIGATTTFFSIVDTMLLRELPYRSADRLVLVHGRDAERGWNQTGVSYPDLLELRERTPALSATAAYAQRAYNLGGGEEPARVRAAAVTAGFFGLVHVAPVSGRDFLPAEDRPGGDRVAVLGHRLWSESFGGDPAVLGRTIFLDGEQHLVVGIAQEGFDYPSGVELWTPLAASPSGAREDRSLQVIARLSAGASVEQARQQLQAASRTLAGSEPGSSAAWVAWASPMRTAVGTKFGVAAIALLTVTGIVLLIACANLANLHLVLMSARRQEIALRAALGASRARIARLLLTEGLVLSLAGGAIGVLIAQWGVSAFAGMMGQPVGISASETDFSIQYRVLLFALAVSVATGVVASLGAAMRGSRVDLRGALQSDSRGAGSSARGQRLRRSLVIAQIAVSLPLVVGASSVALSSLRVEDAHPGFERERLVTARISFAGQAYDTPEKRVAFVEQLLPRLSEIPGAEVVTAASHVPLINRNDVPWSQFVLEEWEPGADRPATSLRYAADGYHEAMGIPLLRGRSFTREEARAATARVVVVNQTMARRFWPGEDPIGKRIRLAEGDPDAWLEVVGVSGDVDQRGPGADPENQLYLPYAQSAHLTLVIRARGEPAELIPDVRAITRSVDPTLPLYDVRTMREAYRWFFHDRLGQGIVLGSLGFVALLLALLGVYGVMAFMVAQRTREFGIRMAIGGEQRDVLRLVLRRAMVLVGIGMGVGLLLAVALSRGLAAMFRDVKAFDPLLLAAVAGLLMGAVLLASYLPARRATRVDPMIALRME